MPPAWPFGRRTPRNAKEVTIFYRRTRNEMPAYEEEIEAMIQEGVNLETLITPVRIITKDGRLAGLECQRNKLGEPDASGRRRPVPIEGSEYVAPLDTLVVAISEGSDIDCISVAGSMEIETDPKASTVKVDMETLCGRVCLPAVTLSPAPTPSSKPSPPEKRRR